jgi:hypothetical protein
MQICVCKLLQYSYFANDEYISCNKNSAFVFFKHCENVCLFVIFKDNVTYTTHLHKQIFIMIRISLIVQNINDLFKISDVTTVT